MNRIASVSLGVLLLSAGTSPALAGGSYHAAHGVSVFRRPAGGGAVRGPGGNWAARGPGGNYASGHSYGYHGATYHGAYYHGGYYAPATVSGGGVAAGFAVGTAAA